MEALIAQFAKLVSINLIRYFIVAGIPFLLFYYIFPNKFKSLKIQIKNATNADFVRELLHSIQTSFIFGGIAVLVLFTPFSEYTQLYKDIHAFPNWWIPLSLLLSLVIHDTYFYWIHRLLHQGALYNYIHLVHHKSTNPSPWASYSFHFLEAILEGLVILPIVLILPMHMLTVGLFILLGFLINVYGHLGYEILPSSYKKSVLFRFLNTSVYHNMHHSHVQGNYSLYFRHWDILMKTENKNYESYFEKVLERRHESNSISSSFTSIKKTTVDNSL